MRISLVGLTELLQDMKKMVTIKRLQGDGKGTSQTYELCLMLKKNAPEWLHGLDAARGTCYIMSVRSTGWLVGV